MSHFSPLLWLCAVSAAALNSFTALDPTGAYEQYLDALGENTPAIAAFLMPPRAASSRGRSPACPSRSQAPCPISCPSRPRWSIR